MKKYIILFFIFFFLLNCNFLYGKSKKEKYVILKKGETLYKISKKYNISIEELCKINNIKDVSKIKAGLKIYLSKSKVEQNLKKMPKYVIIKKGETLYQISKKYNISIYELCRINNINDISKIKAGSKIYFPYYYEKNSDEKNEKINITLKFPVWGKIVKEFGVGDNIVRINAVEFKSDRSSDVFASATGTVKYAGFLKGYGKIVIIYHPGNIATVYAYLDEIFVQPEENVYTGKKIGKLNGNNLLYFQLLKEGKSLDPTKYFEYD